MLMLSIFFCSNNKLIRKAGVGSNCYMKVLITVYEIRYSMPVQCGLDTINKQLGVYFL